MNVLLEIGAGCGYVTRKALATGLIDRVHAFEPQPSECAKLRAIVDPRITVYPFALGSFTGPATIYRGARMDSASLYAGKSFKAPHGVREAPCEVVSASAWFREHLNWADTVVASMNCEGAEVDILSDLAASGEIRKLTGVAVCFDIRKVPSERHREAAARAVLPQIPHVVIMRDQECGLPEQWLKTLLGQS